MTHVIDYDIRVICYPASNIDHITKESFNVSDCFSELISSLGGDASPSGNDLALPSFNGVSWSDQAEFDSIDSTLIFVRRSTDGTVTFGKAAQNGKDGIAGFCLRRVHQPFNAGYPSGQNNPTGNVNFNTVQWEVVSGENWEIVYPPNSDASRIFSSDDSPNTPIFTRTSIALPDNQGFYLDLSLLGKATGQDNAAAIRILFEDGYSSIKWSEGNNPTYETGGAGHWEIQKTFSNVGPFPVFSDQKLTVEVFRLGGVLVFGFNGSFFYHTMQSTDGSKSVMAFIRPGKVGIQTYGQRFNAQFGTINYGLLSDGVVTPRTGSFSRGINRNNLTTGTDTLDALIGGSGVGRDTGAIASATITRTATRISYTCTLTASPLLPVNPATNNNLFTAPLDTPFVTSIQGFFYAESSAGTNAGLDVTAVCLSGHYTGPQPPTTSGATLDLVFDRALAKKLLPTNWQNYIKAFNPIKVTSQYIFSDGSLGDLITIFQGWQMYPVRHTSGYNAYAYDLKCLDEVGRLTKPHAICDTRVPALDWIFNEIGNPVYSYDAVHAIIAMFRGQASADTINGGNLGGYFPPDPTGDFSMYDPMGNRAAYFPSVENPPTDGIIFKPPYKSDPISWLKQVIKFQRGTLLLDRSPIINTGNIPVWLYGRWDYLIKRQTPYVFVDRKTTDASLGDLILDIRVTYLANKMFNRIQVWAPAPDNSVSEFIPTLLCREARLPIGDPNAEEHSWPRVFILEEEFLKTRTDNAATIAQDMATGAMAEFAGRELILLELEVLYNSAMVWGKMLQCNLSGVFSDPALSDITAPITFYAIRVEHKWDFTKENPDRWATTQLVARRASATEVSG